jgi:hypothetical protein
MPILSYGTGCSSLSPVLLQYPAKSAYASGFREAKYYSCNRVKGKEEKARKRKFLHERIAPAAISAVPIVRSFTLAQWWVFSTGQGPPSTSRSALYSVYDINYLRWLLTPAAAGTWGLSSGQLRNRSQWQRVRHGTHEYHRRGPSIGGSCACLTSMVRKRSRNLYI